LKTLDQATDIRRRVLSAFEMAEREANPQSSKAYLTFVVVGGGPTGVELAGALGEITRYTLSKDFRKINPGSTRIILIEAGERVLPSFSPELSRRATRDLESLGVTIWNHSRVTEISNSGVKVGNEWIEARTVIWAAGVKPSELNECLPCDRDRQGRAKVMSDLSLPGHPEVFVIGDQACFIADDGHPLPGLAPVAIQQGRFVAKLIKNELRGKPRPSFRYVDKGQMATIGRKRGVMEFGRLRLAGMLAWLIWLFVHIYYLIGFKNRLFVLWQWAYAYFTFRRGARLITEGPSSVPKNQ
jgi:NADH dehydrogenase